MQHLPAHGRRMICKIIRFPSPSRPNANMTRRTGLNRRPTPASTPTCSPAHRPILDPRQNRTVRTVAAWCQGPLARRPHLSADHHRPSSPI